MWSYLIQIALQFFRDFRGISLFLPLSIYCWYDCKYVLCRHIWFNKFNRPKLCCLSQFYLCYVSILNFSIFHCFRCCFFTQSRVFVLSIWSHQVKWIEYPAGYVTFDLTFNHNFLLRKKYYRYSFSIQKFWHFFKFIFRHYYIVLFMYKCYLFCILYLFGWFYICYIWTSSLFIKRVLYSLV